MVATYKLTPQSLFSRLWETQLSWELLPADTRLLTQRHTCEHVWTQTPLLVGNIQPEFSERWFVDWGSPVGEGEKQRSGWLQVQRNSLWSHQPYSPSRESEAFPFTELLLSREETAFSLAWWSSQTIAWRVFPIYFEGQADSLESYAWEHWCDRPNPCRS